MRSIRMETPGIMHIYIIIRFICLLTVLVGGMLAFIAWFCVVQVPRNLIFGGDKT